MKDALILSLKQIYDALVAGGKNMMGIGVAVAAAGIIVGVVTLGLGGIITEVIEILSGGNFILILIITAIASLYTGNGTPYNSKLYCNGYSHSTCYSNAGGKSRG